MECFIEHIKKQTFTVPIDQAGRMLLTHFEIASFMPAAQDIHEIKYSYDSKKGAVIIIVTSRLHEDKI
jgi:hypothetical protein